MKDPAGLWEALLPKASLPLEYQLEVEYGDGDVQPARPVRVPADARRARPAPRGRAATSTSGSGSARTPRDRRRRRRGVRGLGAERALGRGRRRLQLVGRAAAPDARARPSGHLGAVRPRRRRGRGYKFEIRTQDGRLRLKADPFAFRAEVPPANASVVYERSTTGATTTWLERRARADPLREPMSIYEVHLGSWRRNPHDGHRSLTYRELADELADYVADLGFTHVELMPVTEHPFGGSWGYQVTGYFAPTSRFGTPDDFRFFVDRLHARGIGVILDWVPAHFPRDDWALARFDGTALYEHADPRRGAHPDWGTLSSTTAATRCGTSSSRTRSTGSEYHTDGLRVDAVASMLYLDYSRKAGEWVPNEYGGRENLEAVAFLREMNEVVYGARARRHRRRRGVDRVARRLARRRTWAGSASASSGTWAGCTTRSRTSRRIRSTAASTTTR